MKTAIALGTFDGVHLGHQSVISSAGKEENALALAFLIPPKFYFGEKNIILTDKNRKEELINKSGIKKIEFLDFLRVKDILPEEFFNMLLKKYNPKSIFCGENYTFGKGGKGNVELLRNLCCKNGISLTVCSSVKVDETVVSSSLIRNLLKNGEISRANELLGSEFSFISKVINGDKRGRTIGFPTINQVYPTYTATVKNGVYKSYVIIDGKFYNSITNIGIRPTYKSDVLLCETHILSFSGELYSKEIRVFLKEYIREEKKFSNLEELKNAIKSDVNATLMGI